jgi:hypothetical protein
MIEQFASDAADDALSGSVLPWTPECDSLWINTEALDRARDCRREDRVVIVGQARCATVAPRDVQYGLVRMWEVFVEGRWDVIHQAFRSRDEAVSWLMNDQKGQESPGPAAY